MVLNYTVMFLGHIQTVSSTIYFVQIRSNIDVNYLVTEIDEAFQLFWRVGVNPSQMVLSLSNLLETYHLARYLIPCT